MQMAGVCGVEPWGYSLRELFEMFASRAKHEWDHTSELLAALMEPHRDRKARPEPYTASDLHPMRQPPPAANGTRPRLMTGIEALKQGLPLATRELIDQWPRPSDYPEPDS